MRKGALLLSLVLILGLAFNVAPAQAQSQPLSNLSVTQEVTLSQDYSILTTITQHVLMNIGVITPPHAGIGVLNVTFSFTYLFTEGLPPRSSGVNESVTVYGQRPVMTMVSIYFPPGIDQLNFTIGGEFVDYSLLYRSAATIPRAVIAMNVSPFSPTSYKVLIPQEPGLEVFSIFPLVKTAQVLQQQNASVVSEHINIAGTSYVLIDFPEGFQSLVVLYQTATRDDFLYFYVALLVTLVIASPFLLRRFEPRLNRALPKFVPSIWRVLDWFTSRRLLAIFAIACVMMITLGLVFGPPPVPRVYLSATPDTVNLVGPFVAGAGYQFLTPVEAIDQFNTMNFLGNYNAIVIADLPIQTSSLGLYASSRIYLVTSNLSSSYVTQVAQLFGPRAVEVANFQALQANLASQKVYITTNRLGLPVSLGVYDTVARIEGVLTLVMTFMALAFLSRSLVENGAKGWLFVPEAATLAFLVYVFTTMVFVQTSVSLGLPVALHASISNAESAVGLLGFGGGSRPRELAGILGFIFGAVAGYGGRIKVDRIGILAFIAIVLYLVTDPLTLGQAFYGLMLNLTTSESGGAAGLVAQESVRIVLGQTMDFYGRYISPFFYSSHGAVLYYIGVIPFAAYAKLRKSTSTFLLLFSSLAAAVGFIRVADLDAIEALDSAAPGITIGLMVLVFFLIISLGESRLRRLIA